MVAAGLMQVLVNEDTAPFMLVFLFPSSHPFPLFPCCSSGSRVTLTLTIFPLPLRKRPSPFLPTGTGPRRIAGQSTSSTHRRADGIQREPICSQDVERHRVAAATNQCAVNRRCIDHCHAIHSVSGNQGQLIMLILSQILASGEEEASGAT